MRPRTELGLGVGVLVLLCIGAAALGSRRARIDDSDPRRSTYLYGPSGASAYAEALVRLGVRVLRNRRPVSSLETKAGEIPGLVAFLGPTLDLSSSEGAAIAALPVDLLLAGPAAAPAMKCLGWEVVPWEGGSARISPPGVNDSLPMPRVATVLRSRAALSVVDSSGLSDGATVSCTVAASRRVDTLLRANGRPVAVRLQMDGGRSVTLVSADRLFSNRVLRESALGPFALSLVAPRYRRIVIDEYHHGYSTTRSLAGATLDWSVHSPWGWAIWQLVAVGVIALIGAGVRFGPARTAIERRRRSPLEHVRALATALAAARGHDVAVRLIMQGLRRRLSASRRVAREEPAVWIEALAPAVRTPRGREALGRLTALTRRPAQADDVLDAANDVETLWEELKPS